jgi:hypothetical protein
MAGRLVQTWKPIKVSADRLSECEHHEAEARDRDRRRDRTDTADTTGDGASYRVLIESVAKRKNASPLPIEPEQGAAKAIRRFRR